MAKVIDIKFTDHKEEVLAEMKGKLHGWLDAIGQDAASSAANVLTETNTIDTGRLKNSISHAVDDENTCVYIGTPPEMDYAIYHEFGTGKYVAGGRSTPWSYQDKDGNWHKTYGVPAKHFLQFGASAHQAEYKALLEQALKD